MRTFKAGSGSESISSTSPHRADTSGPGVFPLRSRRLRFSAAIGAVALVASGIGAASLIAAPSAAQAATVGPTVTCSSDPNIFNTGYDAATGGVLGNGADDANWQAAGGVNGLYYPAGTNPAAAAPLPPAGTVYAPAQVGSEAPGAWTPSPFGNAQWISTNYQASGANQPGTAADHGDFYYRYQFTLAPTVSPSSFQLTMNWLADNSVAGVWVNNAAQTGSNIPQAPGGKTGPSTQVPTDPYWYGGFVAGATATTVLNNSWQTGVNTILVEVKSSPGAEGFNAHVSPEALCPSATVAKHVTARSSATDQFTVGINDSTGAVLATATTTGTQTDAVSSPAFLAIGNTYTITDAMAAGSASAIGAYTASAQCTDTVSNTTTALSGNGPTWSFSPTSTDAYACSVTNTPVVALSVSKTASISPYIPGQTETYTITVRNDGPANAVDATVSDPLPAALAGGGFTWTCAPSTGATCAPSGAGDVADTVNIPSSGQVVYTVTGTVPAGTTGDLVNTATVTPPPGTSDPQCSPDCSSTVTAQGPAPALTVVKSADPSDAAAYTPGQVITYHFTVTNTGNVTLDNVGISEGAFNGSGAISEASCPSTTLAPGAQVVCTATYTLSQTDVNQGSITNTATAHGTPPGSNTPVPSDASTVTVPETPAPGITMVKTADPGTVSTAGQTITYSFVVTNTGNVTLTNPKVIEGTFTGSNPDGLSQVDCPQTSLVAGQVETCTATYTVTQADVNVGTISNSATATGTPPGNTTPPVSPPSTSTVTVTRTPALSLVKTANVVAAEVGQTVTYSFTITNTGNVTIENPTVNDTDFSGTGQLSAITCPQGATLQPGDHTVCTATYTVTQADIDAGKVTNTATATGTPPNGTDTPTSPPSTSTVTTNPHPALAVVKTADTQQVTNVGQVVTYTFKVTNTGNVDITNPKVNEGAFNGHGTLSQVGCPGPSTLPPGQSIDCTATYTVVAADLADGGSLSNTATVTGTPPGGGDPITSAPSTATVKEVPPAAAPAAGLASTGSDTWTAGLVGLGLLVLGLLAAAAAWIRSRRRLN